MNNVRTLSPMATTFLQPLDYMTCFDLMKTGFPQTIKNGSWFYIDMYKPPVCLTDVHFLRKEGREVDPYEDPFSLRMKTEYRWQFIVPEDFEARAISEAETVPLSVQAMQSVTFKRLKSLNACKMPNFAELFEELPKALHEHWTKQLLSYEGPFNLRVEWDESGKHFWAGYAPYMGILKGTEKRIELGRPGMTPDDALARLWLFLKEYHPDWLTQNP